jgi:hypothetical protein
MIVQRPEKRQRGLTRHRAQIEIFTVRIEWQRVLRFP